MQASLDDFTTELTNLRHYIDGLELEKKLLALPIGKIENSESETLLLQYQRHISTDTGKKRFNYNSIIISLYGYFEKYIEALIKAYVTYLNDIVPRYEELPKSIAERHIKLSCELIKQAKQQRYKGIITQEELISNLYSCVDDTNNYKINSMVFTQHRANFKFKRVNDLFVDIGIENIFGRVLKHSPTFKEEKPFSTIDELVQLRNEVFHGSVDNLLNNDILLDYISFFEIYGKALHEVVCSFALPYVVKHRGVELGKPFKVLKSGTVAGIELKNSSLRVGDTIIAKPAEENQPYLTGKIKKLEVDGVNRQDVNQGEKVGIEVPFKAKENQTFFLIIPKR